MKTSRATATRCRDERGRFSSCKGSFGGAGARGRARGYARGDSSEMRMLERLAREQGWLVDRTAKNHVRFRSPSGCVVVTSGTPSDWRALLNFKSVLRRCGFRFEAA
jgi:hypothetical protein